MEEEKNLDKAVGGYEPSLCAVSHGFSVSSLKLTDPEYSKLEKAGYIEHSQRDGKDYEYISRKKLEAALNLLNKKSIFSIPFRKLNHELKIDF